EAAGLGDRRDGDNPMVFHDLRHTFGTLAVEAWPLHDVQAYMGHSNVGTTMIYVHHQPKATAADQLSALVAKATGVESVYPTVYRNAEIGAQPSVTESVETPVNA
ncbi:MAG: tyrosine-type recombinase/integrase, partial [Solirubrobacteraceae bacterium]